MTTATTTRAPRKTKTTDASAAMRAAQAAKASKTPAAKAPAKRTTVTSTAPAKPDTKAARTEKAALDQWVARGRKGKKPATPNLDAVQAAATPKKAPAARKRSTSTTPRQAQTVDFSHDGKACPPSQNRLSSLAWYYTKGIDGDEPRISAAALTALLAKAGIDEPNAKAWTHTLPNGVKLSAKARKS